MNTGIWMLLVGLALLSPRSALWAETKGGFQPGGKAFSNPFANNPQPGAAAAEPNGFLEDDDEDEEAPSRPSSGSSASGGGRQNSPQPDNADSLSMGGGPPGGVVTHNKVPNIAIDSETGAGSKEVVTDFNFPDADIMDIAKTLGKLTGKNFILDKDVKGRITIISNSPITVGDAWKAFLTALDINGFALVPSGKYIRIAKQREARDKQLRTYTGEFSPDTDALITRVFPLKYINAEEVTRTFRSFMPPNSRIIPHEQTNTVIVTDTGSNIAKLAKMLEILDIEGYDAGIEVIPVKFASAAELSKLIDTLVPGTGSAPGQPPGAPRFGGMGRFSARRTKEGGIINTIIADERTNTLIVHANSRGAEQVRDLVNKLDRKISIPKGGGKVHVVYLQFADAEAVAATLNNLSSQSGGGFKPPTPGGAGTGIGVNPVAATLFEGSIKVSPDKATNSLVITASPSDFGTIQRVINRLDIPRDEVYVEVVIMELTLGRNFNFSSGVASPSSGVFLTPSADLLNFVTNPVSQKGAIIGFKAGKPTNVTVGTQTIPVSSVMGLIKAIQGNSSANILATPQIIALDNSEATFEAAEKIPVPVTTAVQGAGTATSFQKESVSLKIVIKPQINKLSNFVKLDIDTKLADIDNQSVPEGLQNQAFGTVERNAKTVVVVGDGDTVVIGGLMRDKTRETVNKIPILGDIPLLGWLFRQKDSQTSKTNLLVFMTPHIIRQYEKVRAILDKKLKERDEFLEASAGGEDPMRDARDKIIRDLPNIKDITSKKPTTSFTIDDEDEVSPINQNGTPFSGGKNGAHSNPTPQGALAPGGGAQHIPPPDQSYYGAPPPADYVPPPPPMDYVPPPPPIEPPPPVVDMPPPGGN